MTFPKHTVRAQAFHHQDGYDATRDLALAFAGPNGRLATMEDIVDVRLAQSRSHLSWRGGAFVTDSRLYYGMWGNRPHFVITHGGGPAPVAKCDLPQNQGRSVAYGHELCVTQEQFEALIEDVRSGTLGVTASVIDLFLYRNPATLAGISNEYTYEEAMRDEIIRAYFGRRCDEFLARHRDETHAWLKGHVSDEELARTTVIRKMLHMHYESSWRKMLTDPEYAPHVYPLTLERAYFFHERENASKHTIGYTEMCASVDEQMGGSAHLMVGIRDKEPIDDIALSFRHMLSAIKRHWVEFVEPTKPRDARASLAQCEPPCYVLLKPPQDGMEILFTQRINLRYDPDRESPFTGEPHFPVADCAVVRGPETYTVDRRNYTSTVFSLLKDIVPADANAVLIDWHREAPRKADDDPPRMEIHATFYKVTVDAARCFRPLEELRRDFDYVLDRCQHLGLTALPA